MGPPPQVIPLGPPPGGSHRLPLFHHFLAQCPTSICTLFIWSHRHLFFGWMWSIWPFAIEWNPQRCLGPGVLLSIITSSQINCHLVVAVLIVLLLFWQPCFTRNAAYLLNQPSQAHGVSLSPLVFNIQCHHPSMRYTFRTVKWAKKYFQLCVLIFV